MSTTRYSKQRETIYKILKDNPCHPSVEQLYLKVREEIPNISLGTVYRDLNFLVNQKRIITFKGIDKSHYDARVSPHLHFICSSCGKIEDVEVSSLLLNDIISNVLNKGNTIDGLEMSIHGICNDCKEKEN